MKHRGSNQNRKDLYREANDKDQGKKNEVESKKNQSTSDSILEDQRSNTMTNYE